jgi:hypothetical protein
MSSLVVICLSSHYWFVLLSHYELVPPLDIYLIVTERHQEELKQAFMGPECRWMHQDLMVVES